AAAVRACDGGVRRAARRDRARGDLPDRQQEGVVVATEVKLPRLGQGMESGTIVKWLKSEGDQVEKGEALYELDTDKVTQEVEAEATGVLLKIAVTEGEVEVGKTIGFIGSEGEAVSAPADEEQPKAEEKPKQEAPPKPVAEPAPASDGSTNGRIKA